MGVSEDIQWLKEDEQGLGKIFLLIAENVVVTADEREIGVELRKIKELYGSEDWWPVKAYVRALKDRGLIAEDENGYKLTEDGKKVREGFKAIEYVRQVI